MIKKIAVSLLKPGMYVHDLNCGWTEHPFLRNRFKVEDTGQIRAISQAGIRELYIDTERGLDVRDAPLATEAEAEIERAVVALGEHEIARAQAVPVEAELARARRAYAEAVRIVHRVLDDARLGRPIDKQDLIPVVRTISASIVRNGGALLSLCRIKSKDQYTFQHSVSVGVLMVAFCRALDYDEETTTEAGIGGLLHDVGKMKTPEDILNKPGKLTDDEFVVMQDHVKRSREILAGTAGISPLALQVAAQHHERYDGSGYPERLKGDSISPLGQMASIVDVYDAITSERCYHKPMHPTEAVRKIFEWSKFHFNPQLVHAFVRVVGIYPTGTLVMLESGKLGIVVDQAGANLLQPVVRVIYDARRTQYLPPLDLDLSRASSGERIVGYESAEKWKIDLEKFTG